MQIESFRARWYEFSHIIDQVLYWYRLVIPVGMLATLSEVRLALWSNNSSGLAVTWANPLS